MDKFGFSISAGRQIDFDANDKGIAEFIYENEPSFKLCIECGGCSATCTTANFTAFSLREFNILIKRGEIEKVRQNLKKCMLCGKCTLICPRGVNTRNIVILAKNAFLNSDIYEI